MGSHGAGGNIALIGPLVQEKANEFAAAVGITDFMASNDWLARLRGLGLGQGRRRRRRRMVKRLVNSIQFSHYPTQRNIWRKSAATFFRTMVQSRKIQPQ